MNILSWFNKEVTTSRKLEYVVKTYGPDFLSTYGGGTLLAVSAVFSNTMAPFIAIPVAGALVSLVNQLDHDYREHELLDFYRDQIAAVSDVRDQNGAITRQKKPAEVTVEDLHALADGSSEIGGCPNNILASELANNDRRRNFSIAFHAAAAGVFGLVAYTVLPLLANLPWFSEVLSPLAQVGVGFGALMLYQQIDRTVADIGRVLFDVDRKTAHDNIAEMEDMLHKGQKVEPMQVFSVMVGADNALGSQIEKEFAAKFEDLYLSDKFKAMQEYGKSRDLEGITQSLNKGEMEAGDLVLTMCGRLPAPRFASAPVHMMHAEGTQMSTHYQDLVLARREAAIAENMVSQRLH